MLGFTLEWFNTSRTVLRLGIDWRVRHFLIISIFEERSGCASVNFVISRISNLRAMMGRVLCASNSCQDKNEMNAKNFLTTSTNSCRIREKEGGGMMVKTTEAEGRQGVEVALKKGYVELQGAQFKLTTKGRKAVRAWKHPNPALWFAFMLRVRELIFRRISDGEENENPTVQGDVL